MRKISCHFDQSRRQTDSNSPSESPRELVFLPRTPVSLPDDDIDEEISSYALVRNPSPPVVSTAGGFSMTDLRLLHHWTTSAFASLLVAGDPVADDILQRQLPYLAFRNDFLMHGLLGTAALHMQHLYPNSEEYHKRTDVYRARAFRSFRQALNNKFPDSEAHEAALMMSLLLIILCSQKYLTGKDEIMVLHWIPLYRGLCAILEIKHPGGHIEGTILHPLIHRKLAEVTVTPIVPTILLSMIRAIDSTDPDYKGRQTYCLLLDRLATLYAALCQDGLCESLYFKILTFPSHHTEEFVLFAKQRRPRALIILTYYLSFLKLISGIWWVEGIADKDIPIIARTLDPKWLPFMKVPLQVVEMTDRLEIAKLMLK
jgi:hypothetical protein